MTGRFESAIVLLLLSAPAPSDSRSVDFKSALTGKKKTSRPERLFDRGPDGIDVTEPLVAVLFAPSERVIYVTRSIFSYVQQPYVTQENVVLTREIRKWVRELVATIDLTATSDGRWPTFTRPQHPAARALERELGHDLLLAVIGTSRLPVTSVESPLPGFSLGDFGYFPNAVADAAQPITTAKELIARGLTIETPQLERAKLLELILRTIHADELGELVERFLEQWRSLGLTEVDLTAMLKTLFNHLALTPRAGASKAGRKERLASTLRRKAVRNPAASRLRRGRVPGTARSWTTRPGISLVV